MNERHTGGSDGGGHRRGDQAVDDEVDDEVDRTLTDEVVDEVVIDCDSCLVRGDACSDCVVSVLLGPPECLDGIERTALAVLAGSGLVPPLRLITSTEGAA